MALGWEVGPTKDVVQALMETLVDPRLPSSVSVDDHSFEDAEKPVARQMHAVVLLYNYYHRKQKPELEFLDFVSFCKLALLLRPSLISFMKMVSGSESVELNGAEDQLSVTEKAIKDACDTAMSLDASKDVPTTEGCPISKVAVLLIDPKKENCLLQFGAVTEGVWSLIEKEINESSIYQEILAEEKMRKKRKTNNHQASIDDCRFLQLGCHAVKEVAGIDSSDLMVLETHVVYSLSREKSAAQFYMMQCPQSFNLNQSVPLKFLVESLRGPLAEKFCDSWTTTTLIEYHHLLPYVGFISDWLSRKDLDLPTLNGYNAGSRIANLPPLKGTCEDLDHADTNSLETKISSSEEVANENSEDHQKKSNHSSGGKIASSLNVFKSTKKRGNVIDESNSLNSAKRGASKITLEKADNNSEKHDSATQRMNMVDFIRNSVKSEERKKLKSNNKVYHQSRKNISSAQHDAHGSSAQHDAHGPEDGVDLKVAMPDPPKSNDSLCRDKKYIAQNEDVTISCNQNGNARKENASPVQFQALYNINLDSAPASEELQNALALLDRKRQELYSQICTMEDALASYEQKIERIRDGGEVDLARQCIKAIISGNGHLLLKTELQIQDPGHQPGDDRSNPQSEKKTRVSAIFLPGRFSCQDLEYTCVKNNWRLPRYFVQPSDGKFLSSVVVQGKDFNLSSKSGMESSPIDARESAAAQMIAKIRKIEAD